MAVLGSAVCTGCWGTYRSVHALEAHPVEVASTRGIEQPVLSGQALPIHQGRVPRGWAPGWSLGGAIVGIDRWRASRRAEGDLERSSFLPLTARLYLGSWYVAGKTSGFIQEGGMMYSTRSVDVEDVLYQVGTLGAQVTVAPLAVSSRSGGRETDEAYDPWGEAGVFARLNVPDGLIGLGVGGFAGTRAGFSGGFDGLVARIELAVGGMGGPGMSVEALSPEERAELEREEEEDRLSEAERAARDEEARCDGGDLDACSELASRLNSGDTVARALALWTRACEAGHGTSCWWLGEQYKYDDQARAIPYFRRACQLRESLGCEELLRQLENACSRAIPDACLEMADALERGAYGARRDPTTAAQYRARARAMQGGEP